MSKSSQHEYKTDLVITHLTVLRICGVLAIVAGIVNMMFVVFGSLEFEAHLLLITFLPGIICLVLGNEKTGMTYNHGGNKQSSKNEYLEACSDE